MDNLEYLETYSTRAEAEEIKTLLENSGVKCVLQFNEVGDVMEGVGADTGPTQIYVVPEHLEKAREIIGVRKEN